MKKLKFFCILFAFATIGLSNTGSAQSIGFSISNHTIVDKDTFHVVLSVDSLLTGKGVYSYKLGMNYNASYVEYLGIDSVGSLLAGWGLPTVNSTAGSLIFAGAGAVALNDKGGFIYLRFRAKQAGNTNLNWNSAQCMLNEGNPALKFKNGYVNASGIPFPDIWPDNAEIYVGQTVQMNAGSGTSPYTYSSANAAIASVSHSGLVSGMAAGTTKISVTDSKGNTASTTGVVDVRGIKLSIQPTGASPQDTFYLPVKIEIAPGTMVYSGSFELTFNGNLEGTKSLIEAVDYPVSLQSNGAGMLVKISFASATPLSGNGTLCRVALKALNTGTHQVNIQNALFNENLKAFTTSGTVGVECKPTTKPTGLIPADNATNQKTTFTVYWQPSLNVRYYNLFLWKDDDPMPASPTRTHIYSTSTSISDLTPGKTYKWKIVAVNDCSTLESDIVSFTVRNFPDLSVTSIAAPTAVLSGSRFDVSFTIKNIGQESTGASQWRDVVYISNDSSVNGAKTQLMVKYNLKQLAVDESYSQTYTLTMPTEYSGKYYLFVRTDVYNELAELSEGNNQARFSNSVQVTLKPFPDILVKDIQATGIQLVPADSLEVNWKVENVGNADALGGWTERITIVPEVGQRILLSPYPSSNVDLPVGQTINRKYKFKIPDVLRFSGNAHIEVALIPSASLVELTGTTANNTLVSTGIVSAVDRLFFRIEAPSLSEGSTAEVRCVVTRSGNFSAGLPVSITHQPSGQINIPSNVTINANTSTAIFNLTAIDNTLVEGNRMVTVKVNATNHRGDSANIQILDNEATLLKASLSKTTANEGDSLTLRIARNLVTNMPLTVSLSTNKPTQWQFNNAATIPANDSVVVVPIYVFNDKIAELTEDVTLTVSSGGFVSAQVLCSIVDDDMPQLDLTLTVDTISETAGMYACYAKLKRLTGDGSITVNLSASVAGALILPASITMPSGTTTAQFNIGVVDNGDVDGYRKIDITGAVYLSSCGCSATHGSGGVVTKSLVIADNDGPALSALVSPVSLFEGKVNAGKLIISRNTGTVGDLVISINHNDTSEVSIPATATILNGQKSVEVPINTINDGIEDGNQMVNVTVAASGYVSGFCVLYVTDQNKPDYVLSHVAISRDSVLTNDSITVQGVLLNQGYLNAPSGSKLAFYLSKDIYLNESDDQLLNTFVTKAQLLMGDSVAFSSKLKVPNRTGKYYLLPHANPLNVVSELVYTNNTFTPISIVVRPEYTATATVDITQVLQDVPVTIYGKATKVDGSHAANADVDVYLLSNGTRKELKARTDASGNYTVVFTPLTGESGHYQVGASYPNEGLTTVQDEFDIFGFKRVSTDHIIWMTKVGDPLNASIQIKNNSNVPLHNVKMSVLLPPDGFTITPQALTTLSGNGVATLNYSITGTKPSTTKDYQKLKFVLTSDEGVNLTLDAYYYCQEQQAVLESNPSSIITTVTKGTTKFIEFNLFNKGAGESGKITIAMPKVKYMSLVSSDTIANLKTGESAKVIVKLTDEELTLNTPASGTLAFNSQHGPGFTLPYKVEAVSFAKGGVKIDVVDEYTYNTIEAPHVKNAHVTIKHPFSGAIIAEGFTNANGIFAVDSIPEGYYSMTVEAEKHEGYRNNIIVDAGKTLEQTIFVSFQAITYTWEVVRTEIEDEYKIDLIMKFETNVPAPVVIMEMPDSMPHLVNDQTFPFMVTLTNKGLITAVDLTLNFPNDPEYEFITNFTKIDLLAQHSIQVPVVMKRKAGYQPAPGMRRAASASLNCSDYVVEAHGFYCGPDKKWHTGVQLFKFSGRVCTGSPSGGGGGYSGGGGPSLGWGGGGYSYVVPSSNGPTVSVNSVTECDNCLMDLTLTVLGCLPGPIGPAMGVIQCIKAFADDNGVTLKDAFDCGFGFVPGWGCVYGLFNVAYSCYQDPPILFVKRQQAPAGINAAKPLMPPIIKQAMKDLLWAKHSADADKAWMEEIIGIDSVYSRINFVDLINELDAFTSVKKEIKPEDVVLLKQKLQGTDILQSEIDAFAVRWNNTLQALSLGIEEPNATYPNIISNKLLKKYVAQSDSAKTYAIGRGYADVREMANTAYGELKDQLNTNKKSVCASITLKISQKLVMTREAFEGTLTIENGNTQTAMTKIKLNLEVKNSAGVLCNDLFQINTKALSILTGIDGTGELAAGKKGSASILFIPEKGAAPQVPTSYSFGGSFSYIDPFNGLEVTKQLFPVTLEVNPSPDLHLHYFMQRDILGDDPLTEAIEPVIQAELALMIQNNGFGPASKVRVESAQPEIIENEKGLAIQLALIGSNLNGQDKQLGLTNIDFGNIPPKSSAIGQWWFTSSLMGHFINYETRVVHSNSFGNPDLSLISGATLHELIKSVRVYNPDDGINDFLVNEVQDANETPDAIYTSNGVVLPVASMNNLVTVGTLSAPSYQLELHASPKLLGWNYGKVSDPTGGIYKIESVTRQSDGKLLPLVNVWQTHVTMPDGKEPVYEQNIHFVDDFSSVQLSKYTLKFAPKAVDPPTVLRVENVPSKVITTRLNTVRVVFEKDIESATFTWEDMFLSCQGGANLMSNAVVVTKVNSTTFDVNLSAVTLQDGYYVLTIETTGIKNPMGETGYLAKLISWSQFPNTPAVDEIIGLPNNGGLISTALASIMIRFTTPIDTLTFTPQRLMWKRNGVVIPLLTSIARMDNDAKLFNVEGLDTLSKENGIYELIVDMTQIKSQTGVFGLSNLSRTWQYDTHAPFVKQVKLNNLGGFDFQHITSADIILNEKITGLQMNEIELWRDTQQQPTAQLNIVQLNDTTYRLNDFRLLTYYEGSYSLKINMSNTVDMAGNSGAGLFVKNWIVNRELPQAVSEMKISPDKGVSASDGVTSESHLTVSMKVNTPNARIKLYYNSLGASALLLDTLPASTGLFIVPITLPIAGSMKLQAVTVDSLGNNSTSEIPIYVDDTPLSATWTNVPIGILRKHPESVLINLSDRILSEIILKDNLECRLNGVIVPSSALNLTKINDMQFALGGFGNVGVATGGNFSIALSTGGLSKYLSGKSGMLSPQAQWTLRGNNPPVANAGENQNVSKSSLVMLDGSASFDNDNDALTYHWTPPSGITLSSQTIARPLFVAPDVDSEVLIFTLVVNDGITDSAPIQITVNVSPIVTDENWLKKMTNNIVVTPNPSKGDRFVLHLSDWEAGVLNVRVFNTDGKLMFVENRSIVPGYKSYKFEKLNLQSGSYLIDVRLNEIKPIGLLKLIVVK